VLTILFCAKLDDEMDANVSSKSAARKSWVLSRSLYIASPSVLSLCVFMPFEFMTLFVMFLFRAFIASTLQYFNRTMSSSGLRPLRGSQCQSEQLSDR
jgi:hypothetical protein